MNHNELYLLALTDIKAIGPVVIKRIIEFFGDPIKPFKARKQDLLNIEGMTEKAADEILRMDPEKRARKILKDMDKEGIQLWTIYDRSYPPLLKEIYDPPPVLYFKGDFKDDLCIGVVGTRHPTTYGKIAVEKIAKSLTAQGATVVSGLARGIDTMAHKATLEEGGRTIAVMGCGFRHLYPRENRKLAEKIAKHGAIISEFSLDTPPFPENFPRRNRIISGLCEAVVVVEAAAKSGALITANYALHQGRDVLAVPGHVTSEKSAGTNNLIKEGAIPVLNFENIVEDLPERLRSSLEGKTKETEGKSPRETKEACLDKSLSLRREEKEILALLSIDHPMHIDQIAEKCMLRINRLLGSILSLEIKGLVEHLPGNHYIKKIRN